MRSYRRAILGAAFVAIFGGTASAAEITILRELEADRYDPHKVTARAATEILNFLGDTLVAVEDDLKTVVPSLAEEWSVSDDGLVYTFKLRDDVEFCGGRPMTADDVVYSMNRWIAEETASPVAWRAGKVEAIKAVDDHTVEYRLQEPFSELLLQLAQGFAVIVDRESVETLGEDFGVKGFGGTGPYCWVSWSPRNDFVMERHDAYRWGPPIYDNRGPAKAERIVWKVVPEATTRIAAIERGEADVTYATPLWAVDQLKANPKVSIAAPETFFWTNYLGMKITRDLMGDMQVRKALNYAIDRQALVDGVFFGHAEPAYNYVHPAALDFDPKVKDKQVSYDPDKAKQLLEEAGWTVGSDGMRQKDGQTLSPVLYGFTTWREQLEAVQGMLREVGVDLQLQLWDASVGWGKLKTQEFDIFAMNYPYNSVGDAYNLYFRSQNMPAPNRMNWDDAETDQLLDAGRSAATDQERFAAYSKVQHKIYDNYLWIPLVHEDMFVVWSDRITGVKPHGFYGNGLYKGLDMAVAE